MSPDGGLRAAVDVVRPDRLVQPGRPDVDRVLEGAVQHRRLMAVDAALVVCRDVVQPDRAVPGGDQQKLGRVGAKRDACDAVLRSILQLELCPGLGHSQLFSFFSSRLFVSIVTEITMC